MEALRERLLRDVETVGEKRRLACAKAFRIAKDLDVTLKDISRMCEEENIKISGCQLGCF